MALVLKDRIKQQTTTTGTTDAYALSGSFTGFETFAEIGDGNTTYYCCTDGTDFEIGIGTFTASGATLARTTILQSSNSDAAVDWQTGTRTIFVTQPAQKAVFLDASNIATFSDVDIDGGSIDGVTIGTNSAVTDLRVDRLKFNFNSISNTVTNDHITLNPNGTGTVRLNTDSLRIGDLGADVTVTTIGTGDLTLSTNEGTDTGTIVIADGVDGNISLTPNGTGEVDISKVDIDGGAIDGVTLGTNSAITELQVDNININGSQIDGQDTSFGTVLKANGQFVARIQSTSQNAGGGLYFYQNNGYITFEGASPDAYETNLKVTDPTDDRDITFPDATGTVAVEETGGLTLNNGVIALKNGGAQSEVRLYCESSNAHYAALKAPVHSDLQTSGNTTLTLPAVTTGTLVSTGDSGSVSTAMIADNAVTGDKLNDIANVSGSYTNADITVDAQGRITAAATGSGGGGGGSASDSFKTIAVTGTSGQSDVVASSSTDTLTFVAGSNMTITTDASTDTITFASSGGGGGGGGGITTGKAIAMAMIFG